jgi:hypothetical protein
MFSNTRSIGCSSFDWASSSWDGSFGSPVGSAAAADEFDSIEPHRVVVVCERGERALDTMDQIVPVSVCLRRVELS